MMRKREKWTLCFVRHFITRLRCVSHSPLSCSYDCLTVYLPLKLENSWYPVLYESTDRNELASGIGRCELFLIRSFFMYPSVCFPVLHSLLFAALVLTSHVLSQTLFLNSLSRSGVSAKWRKSTLFHSKSRNSSNTSKAFRTIIDFRNDFNVLHKSLFNARSGV